MRRSFLASLIVILVCAAALAASPANAASDRCVRGQWVMPNERANTFLRNMLGNPLMRVKSGVLTAGFNATQARYGSTHFVLQMSLGAAVLRASATFIYEAPYRTVNRKLLFGRGHTELVIGKFQGIKNGKTITIPGPPPQTRATPAGASPYVCTRSTLRWKVPFPGPDGTWAGFDKAR